jgi:hypothetical protein
MTAWPARIRAALPFAFICFASPLIQQGNAWYQATFMLAAGVDLDIYSGSENIVLGIEATATICQRSPRPAYCAQPPLAGTIMCSANQYDPNAVYRCRRAAGSMTVSVGLANCSCAISPDSAVYQRNLGAWMSSIMTQNSLAATVSVPEGRCLQVQVRCWTTHCMAVAKSLASWCCSVLLRPLPMASP